MTHRITSFSPRPVAFQPGQLAFLETHYMDHDRRKDGASRIGQHHPEEAMQLLHWRTLLPGGRRRAWTLPHCPAGRQRRGTGHGLHLRGDGPPHGRRARLRSREHDDAGACRRRKECARASLERVGLAPAPAPARERASGPAPSHDLWRACYRASRGRIPSSPSTVASGTRQARAERGLSGEAVQGLFPLMAGQDLQGWTSHVGRASPSRE